MRDTVEKRCALGAGWGHSAAGVKIGRRDVGSWITGGGGRRRMECGMNWGMEDTIFGWWPPLLVLLEQCGGVCADRITLVTLRVCVQKAGGRIDDSLRGWCGHTGGGEDFFFCVGCSTESENVNQGSWAGKAVTCQRCGSSETRRGAVWTVGVCVDFLGGVCET